MKQIEPACFDAVNINLNFADCGGQLKVLPTAREKGLAVISREAFMKGELFKMGDEVGLADRNKLVRIALKWNLWNEEVTTVVVGADNPNQLLNNLEILNDLEPNNEEREVTERIKTSSAYQAYEERKTRQFLGKSDCNRL